MSRRGATPRHERDARVKVDGPTGGRSRSEHSNSVLVGIRTDLTWSLTDTGVISDATGKVLLNAYQQDYTLLRCYWRVALQVAQPLGVKPLALAEVAGTRTAAASRATK
jgi:hypothetical protein